jgi:hypothetical protein
MPNLKDLSTPPLRHIWSEAKKAAEAQAKKDKQVDKFTALSKKLKEGLGSKLDDWPKNWPSYEKLDKAKSKIDEIGKKYQEAIKAAKAGGLNENTTKLLKTALKAIEDAMPKRLKTAEELLKADEELQIKLRTKESITYRKPITIYNQDVTQKILAKAGDAAKLINLKSFFLELRLHDQDVLKHVPENVEDGYLAGQIRAKVPFDALIKDFAEALEKAADEVTKQHKSLSDAQSHFNAAIEKVMKEAVAHAAEPVLKLGKVKAEYRNYQIKAGGKLAMTGAGIVAGVAGLAATPLTAGVSTILGAFAVIKGGASFGAQLADLSAEAEDIGRRLSAHIVSLGKQYFDALTAAKKSGGVGAAEMAKTVVNSVLFPDLITTIGSCHKECKLMQDKINGIEKEAHKGAGILDDLLEDQAKMQKELTSFKTLVKPAFTGAEQQMVEKLVRLVDQSGPKVTKLWNKVTTLIKRVEDTKTTHKDLAEKVAKLDATKPLWSQVGEMVIKVTVAAGFIGAGHVPEHYEFGELAHEITGIIEDIDAGLDTAAEIGEDLVKFVKDAKQ